MRMRVTISVIVGILMGIFTFWFSRDVVGIEIIDWLDYIAMIGLSLFGAILFGSATFGITGRFVQH